MAGNTFKYVLLFAGLVLIQVLLFNHICLFGVAVPIVFIYFIIKLPMDFGINKMLTCSFIMGLFVDIWSDTPGMNALACTVLAMVRNKVYYMYVAHDDRTEVAIPSLVTLGVGNFCKYALTMTALYCLMIFSIEYFSFYSVKDVAIMSLASLALTFPLILGLDCLMLSKREKRL